MIAYIITEMGTYFTQNVVNNYLPKLDNYSQNEQDVLNDAYNNYGNSYVPGNPQLTDFTAINTFISNITSTPNVSMDKNATTALLQACLALDNNGNLITQFNESYKKHYGSTANGRTFYYWISSGT